jgi:2-iminobutanoate/2-iminopropanoate deaminase
MLSTMTTTRRAYQTQEKVPLSRAVEANGMLFLSGDGSVDHASGALVQGGVAEQTRRTIENLRRTLESVGSSLDRVVKVTVYLTDMSHYGAMNEAYRSFFPTECPARTTVGVAELPVPGLLVEMELVALR